MGKLTTDIAIGWKEMQQVTSVRMSDRSQATVTSNREEVIQAFAAKVDRCESIHDPHDDKAIEAVSTSKMERLKTGKNITELCTSYADYYGCTKGCEITPQGVLTTIVVP